MARTLSGGMTSAFTADVVRPILLIDAMFDTNATLGTAPLYLWNGVGNLNYDNKTYGGAGTLLSVGAVSEKTDLTATGVSVVLSGIQGSILQTARDAEYQGRALTIKVGALDANGDIIADPIVLFSGFMDTMSIGENGQTSSISVNVENRLVAFERSKIGRYTNQDQRSRVPGDKGLEYVAAIQDKQIFWGRSGAVGGGGYITGGNGGRNQETFVQF